MTEFATSVDRLHNQVRHWEQGRWWSRTPGASATRGDLMYALIQQLADLGADAEHRPRRPVPREHDMVLPDQLRVLADDLLAAAPPAALLAEAAAAVDELRVGI
ncbi:hypothetical protein [Actinoplanes sp. NPDC051411]|uniref:hypothetical protein n=1 Tax=Actinoplanes sp. NPDC051411 TaxID=3155522 RepID=UPI00341FCFD6